MPTLAINIYMLIGLQYTQYQNMFWNSEVLSDLICNVFFLLERLLE